MQVVDSSNSPDFVYDRGDDRCDLRQRVSADSFCPRRKPATLGIRETKSATAELLAQHPILLAQIVDCLLLLLIHPARDGNQHEPKRVENAHCSTVSWALCIVFSAFDVLDNTGTATGPCNAHSHAHGEERNGRQNRRSPARSRRLRYVSFREACVTELRSDC